MTGGIEICELMTTQNVITPLVKIITEYATAATFEKNDLHAVLVLEQSIALLSNLCESCQAAINELTGGNLLAPIMLIAEKSRAHPVLLLETLKLLLLITESNQRLNEIFGANATYQKIIGDTVESDQLSQQIKLTAVGIAMNIKAIMQAEANVVRLLPVIERALAYDAVNVTQLAQHVADHWELAQRSTLDEEVRPSAKCVLLLMLRVTRAVTLERRWRIDDRGGASGDRERTAQAPQLEGQRADCDAGTGARG